MSYDDVLFDSLRLSDDVGDAILLGALVAPRRLRLKDSRHGDAIAAMLLGGYADKLIGGHCFTKRLPTAHRRQVSIARELVMRPHVLFIDEPLYHLGSFPAL